MTIAITKNGSDLQVRSPYHPTFPPRAKALGGRFVGGVWVFDVRREGDVRGLCQTIYGTDGSSTTDLVTLRARAGERGVSADCEGVYLAGRCVARARGRDTGAVLGEGVAVLEGTAGSGGSMKNWVTRVSPNALVELLDVPRAAAEAAVAEAAGLQAQYDEAVRAHEVGTGGDPSWRDRRKWVAIEIVEQAAPAQPVLSEAAQAALDALRALGPEDRAAVLRAL